MRAGFAAADIAAAFQDAAVATLTNKVELALQQTARTQLAVVGGVGRNAVLRARLANVAAKYQATLFHPPLRWCTDNAAMIAYAGMRRLQDSYAVTVRPRWALLS